MNGTLETINPVREYLELLLKMTNNSALTPETIETFGRESDWIGERSCLQTQGEFCQRSSDAIARINLGDMFVSLFQDIASLRECSKRLEEVKEALDARSEILRSQLTLPIGYRSTHNIHLRLIMARLTIRRITAHQSNINQEISFCLCKQGYFLNLLDARLSQDLWRYYDRGLFGSDQNTPILERFPFFSETDLEYASRLRRELSFTDADQDLAPITDAELRFHQIVSVIPKFV